MVSDQTKRSLFVSAGDPSGDIAGFHFLRALLERHPELELFGLGGDRMKGLGQEQFVPGEQLAALGFWEVARRYLFFRRLFKRAVNEIKIRKPQALVLIDYPGFNLRLAKALKGSGIPIVYYISPQVWAWGKGRIPLMRELLDRLLVILPFEKEFFSDNQIEADYVGHYLLEDIPAKLLDQRYNPQSRIVTLMPGSRQQEIDRMLPTMLETARRLSDGYQVKIAGRSTGLHYDTILADYPEFRESLVLDKTRELVAESALVISSSGTATLETALIGRPLIILYKTGWLTYQIARRVVAMKHIGLANIVAGESVAPEYIQSEANPAALAEAANALLGAETKRNEMVERFKQVRAALQPLPGGASARVAEIVSEYV